MKRDGVAAEPLVACRALNFRLQKLEMCSGNGIVVQGAGKAHNTFLCSQFLKLLGHVA